MLTRRTTLSLPAFAGLRTAGTAESANAQGSGSLLPANRNPAAVGLVSDPLVRHAIEIFDGPAEKRWYDRVDQLDGLTIGFGHWPQSELSAFLRSMRDHNRGSAFERFMDRLAEFYTNSAPHWARAPLVDRPVDADAVRWLLDRTLYNPAFMDRYKANCSKDARQFCLPESPSFFRENCGGSRDWIGTALRYGLRDRDVVGWQVWFWTAGILDPVRSHARTTGMDDEAGLIALASMRSSAWSYLKRFVQGAQSGSVSHGDFSWPWDRAGGGAPQTPTALASWRRLAAWQYYNATTRRIRGRSQTYFEAFLAQDWRLPVMKGSRPDWAAYQQNSDPNLVRWIASTA